MVVSPIGFVSDHLEVVWDLDNEAAGDGEAARPGVRPGGDAGTDPRFVAMVRELVQERTDPDGAQMRRLGTLPRPGTPAPTDCCAPTRRETV